MMQFKNINLESDIPFIYPKKICKNYFIINEIVKQIELLEVENTEEYLASLENKGIKLNRIKKEEG